MIVADIALLWLAAACGLLALLYRRRVLDAWSEPVLGVPVVILESDDWGYGPAEQAAALTRIAAVLARFRDASGAHPVMTLGVVLGGPDTERIRGDGPRSYHRLTLADRPLAAVVEAMRDGAGRGVFALQLHGMEHFWPACVMRAAIAQGNVASWLTGPALPSTEALPSALQSRWIDAVELPSKPLPAEAVTAAATEEVRTFASVFGAVPDVAVPPTFVWPIEVEAAWARAGVRVVVTPGYRSDARDADGRMITSGRVLFNGAKGCDGIVYVVRDCYLEPSLGHTHHRTLQDVRAKTRLGRPTLVEIHRANFVGDARAAQKAVDELSRLLESLGATVPLVRYMSTAELARQLRDRSGLVDRRILTRVHVLMRRLASIPRLRKLAWATGAALPCVIAYALTWPWRLRHADCVAT